jgi:hypothetical protein
MKKIILMFVAICAFAACDPVHEDISNGGHISVDELISKTTVTVDKAASGQNGNVISCETLAPVNAKWNIGGKEFVSNFAKKKMKLGSYNVILTAICADGTQLTAEFPVTCQEITDPLQKFYIYGEDPVAQPPFTPAAWDAAAMRFSDSEGKHLPYLSDDVYWGFKTLVFDISNATDDCAGRVMNGWWSARYDGDTDVHWTNGLWELPLTEAIAKDCARGNGGSGKDLDIMVTSGSMTINSIYYEE